MPKVVANITMSLDGFITDPHEQNGDPGRLHAWMFDARTEADGQIVDEMYASIGAVVIGKGMFDVGFEPWGDPPPFGMPVFVVTHADLEPRPMQGGTTYHFVSDGLEAAIEQARTSAGDRDVGVWGGADIVRKALLLGLLDELHLHLAPVLLGGGVSLFEGLTSESFVLKPLKTIETPAATHLRFEVVR